MDMVPDAPPVRRFDRGVTTFGRRTRLLITAPLVLVDLFFVVQIVLWSFDDDPRVAALYVVFLSFSALATVIVGRGAWRSSAEWTQQQHRIEVERQRIQRIVAGPPRSDRF
jgi:hypothetical protein